MSVNLKQKINRLRRVSPELVPTLVAVKVRRTLNAWWGRMSSRPSFDLRHRRRLAKIPDHTLRFIHPDVFAPDFSDRFKSLYPQEFNALLSRADRAAACILDVLGSGPVDLKAFSQRTDLEFHPAGGQRKPAPGYVRGLLPWHFDFKKGVGWSPDTFFTDVVYGDIPGVDVKVPWELSRCQHFVTLGQAYLLTRDETYARAFAEQIQDWIVENPPFFGVNWSCAMEVALRASNWILALEFFAHSPHVTEDLKKLVYGSLWDHGQHIRSNLEWNADVSSNHYLSDLFGLFCLGSALDRPDWRTHAEEGFKKEILNQTYEDGFDFEASVPYHRLVLELFFYFSLGFLRRSSPSVDDGNSLLRLEQDLGAPFANRFRLMFEALSRLSSPEGRVPLIGDNDSGRVFVFSIAHDFEMAPILSMGALFLNTIELYPEESNAPTESVWLFGFQATSILDSPIERKREETVAPASLSSGLLTLRGEHDTLVFSAQPNGTKGLGNHTHNDKLSVTLNIKGDCFLVDPGSAAYTADPATRNRFRSTAVHNTVMVDGTEQNDFVAGELFTLKDQARVVIEKYGEEGFLTAAHTGYERLSPPVRHRRSVQRHAAILMWDIEDSLDGKGSHLLRWNFTVGPLIAVSLRSPQEVLLRGKNGDLLITLNESDLQFKIEEAAFSPRYGVIKPTKAVTVSTQASLPLKVRFTLLWKTIGD